MIVILDKTEIEDAIREYLRDRKMIAEDIMIKDKESGHEGHVQNYVAEVIVAYD